MAIQLTGLFLRTNQVGYLIFGFSTFQIVICWVKIILNQVSEIIFLTHSEWVRKMQKHVAVKHLWTFLIAHTTV